MNKLSDNQWVYLDCVFLVSLWYVIGADSAISLYVGIGLGSVVFNYFRDK